jgi:hypothetical protein
MAWNPTVIKSVDAAYATASEAMRVKTDAGYGFLKALGNRGGPHLLAADWVGTKLAGLLWQRAAFVAHSFVSWLPNPLRPVQPPLV